ncbi:RcpC/CpaB family pilus assembly protein [Hoyosella sp. YIM 151337]|uniref:RcpC/CpaB family pilus assembly protein n=1 Tax=Hoyosella sp. YIM 151337 TaxID=2992742 RepID=UPI002235E646|nr:RcpC/CpaB family pilus assembly protein [Hoyosella sp. YIM 151337]MCW4352067.1 RcpC/CpaB family pilus assembly protein [Hoyosella sp. YIM 151337]
MGGRKYEAGREGEDFASLSPQVRDRAVALAQRIRARASVLRRIAAGLLALAGCVVALQAGGGNGQAVLVAARDIGAGEELTPTDVASATVGEAPATALGEAGQAIGQRTASPVRAGEVLTDARILTPHLIGEIAGNAPARAVPVRLADPAVAGLLRPGDRVDVLAESAHSRGGSDADSEPAALAEDAAVLFIAHVSERSDPLVVLALEPPQALAVAAASMTSAITVTLR